MGKTKYEILIVDDDQSVANSLKDSADLAKSYTATTVNSGEQALELVKKTKFNAYLVDQKMPGMTGTEFIAELMKLDEKALIYVITAEDDGKALEAAEKPLEEGGLPIMGYIQKPWNQSFFTVDLIKALNANDEKEELASEVKEKEKKIEKLENENIELLLGFCEEVEGYFPELEESVASLEKFVYRDEFDFARHLLFLSSVNIVELLECYGSLNRIIHTLKGNSLFMGLVNLNLYCHKLEEITTNLPKGSLYMDAEVYDIISAVPAVVERFIAEIKREYSDTSIPVDKDVQEILDCKDRILREMGGKVINLKEIKTKDIGKVRERKKEIKINIDLSEYDDMIENFQSMSQSILNVLRLNGIAINTINSKLTEHLDMLITTSHIKIDLSRYNRMVNDLKKSLNKKLKFSIPRNTAFARPNIWESAHGALVHLVRNAVDHGVEDPEKRKKLGKPEEGTIELSVFEDHRNLYLTLEDDGGGIDDVKVGEIALSKGIVTQDELANMSKVEKQKLIFRAGFSTKSVASDVSGRGVGMDVVIKEIESNLHGIVNLDSTKDVGTKIKIVIPKVNTLSECIIFGDDDRSYGIHKTATVEYIDYDEEKIANVMDRSPVYTGGGLKLPLLYVFKFLNHSSNGKNTIIKINDEEHGDIGLVVPQVKGHHRIRIENEKLKTNHLNFGYGILNNEPIVILDIVYLRTLVN